MRIFRNRPLALLCFAIALSAVFAMAFSLAVKLVLLALSLAFCLALSILRHAKPKKKEVFFAGVLISVGIFLGVCSSYLYFDVTAADFPCDAGDGVTVTGEVTERYSYSSYETVFRVKLSEADEKKDKHTALLVCPYPSALQIGDVFVAETVVNAVGDDLETTYIADGCALSLSPVDAAHCTQISERHGLSYTFHRWSLSACSRLYHAVGGEEGALAVALLLGNRSFLSADTVIAFRRSGVSHLLALSGLHVSILMGLFEWVLKKCRVPKTLRMLSIPVFSLFYLGLTGFSPSTVRAVLMTSVLVLGYLLQQTYDSFTSLSVTLAGILLVTPYAVADLSLWLSYLSAGAIVISVPLLQKGIVSLVPPCKATQKVKTKVRSLLRAALLTLGVGVAANIGLLLLTATVFGEISLASVPVTLILSPVLSLLLPLLLPTLALPSFIPLTKVSSFLAGILLKVCASVTQANGLILPLTHPIVLTLLVAMTACFVLLVVLPTAKKRLWVIPPLLAVLALSSSALLLQTPLYAKEISFAMEKDGYFTVISEHGKAVAVDCSDETGRHASVLSEEVRAKGCVQIDELILPNYYNRQTYLIASLSKNVRVKTLRLKEPETEREEQIAKRLEAEATLHGIGVVYGLEGLPAFVDPETDLNAIPETE